MSISVHGKRDGIPVATVTDTWSPEIAAKIRAMGPVMLELNWALGWEPCPLDILTSVPNIIGVEVMTTLPIASMRPLEGLPNLQSVILTSPSRTRTDWSRLPKLNHLAIGWEPGDESLAHLQSLRSLFVECLPREGAKAISHLRRLRELRLNTPKFESVDELGRLPDLETLELSVCRKLKMEAIGGFESVRNLEIAMGTVSGLESQFAKLVQLEELSLSDCRGPLASLTWISNCPRLRYLAIEQLRVMDGDLRPVHAHRALREFRAMHYDHYVPSVAMIQAKLESASLWKRFVELFKPRGSAR